MAKKCEICEILKDELAYYKKMVDRLHMQLGINPVDPQDINISDKIDSLVSDEATDEVNLNAETFGE